MPPNVRSSWLLRPDVAAIKQMKKIKPQHGRLLLRGIAHAIISCGKNEPESGEGRKPPAESLSIPDHWPATLASL